MRYFNIKKGFTLIELLVVVSIISMLSSIVFASLRDAKERAKINRAKLELNQLVKVIEIARGEQNKLLKDITGSTCSDCLCRDRDVRNIPSTHYCYMKIDLALSKIEKATNNTVTGLQKMIRDPWGSPYMIDENEGESGGCTPDNIKSAGPNGILGNITDDYDDIVFRSSSDYCN